MNANSPHAHLPMRPLPAIISQHAVSLRPLPLHISSAADLDNKRLFRSTILIPRLNIETEKDATREAGNASQIKASRK